MCADVAAWLSVPELPMSELSVLIAEPVPDLSEQLRALLSA
jgi:hypothetical protein